MGQVEMDASLMNGTNFECGAVCCLQNFQNPIQIAQTVMMCSEHVLLAGDGARIFAEQHGYTQVDPETHLLTEREIQFLKQIQNNEEFTGRTVFENTSSSSGTDINNDDEEEGERRGTVGCVALDIHGNIAAGTSTGGIPKKLPGRTGDTPLIGSGTYCDSTVAGASTTGWGESIMKVQLAGTAVRFIEFGMVNSCQEAADRSISYLEQKVTGGLGGIIMLTRQGQYGISFNTKRIAVGYIDNNNCIVSTVLEDIE
jgi:beta-aspartyl-peptidase (threonine type)